MKKGGKLQLGYKCHTAVDGQGMILGFETTPANASDTTMFAKVLHEARITEGLVCADKGYDSKKNRAILEILGLEDGIMRRIYKKMDAQTKKETRERNCWIQRMRYKVERTFGGLVSWFWGQRSRYKGVEKTEGFHAMLAIGHNLTRLPNLLKQKAAA